MPGRVLCCLSAVAVTPALRPPTEANTEGKQDASGWEVQEGFKAERISSEEKGSEMEEASAEEEEETVDELLRKMAEQPADAALQLRGLEAMQGGSWDPHLAAAAIVAAMQAHPQDRALQLEACRAALDHIFEKLVEAEFLQRAFILMEHGLIAPVRVAILFHSDDHRLFDAAVEVLFRMYQSAIQRNSYIASEALLRDDDAAIVALLLARLQCLVEAPEPLVAAASAEMIAFLLSCYCLGGPEVLQDSEGFQELGCLLLYNLAGGPPEVKEELLRAGAVGGVRHDEFFGSAASVLAYFPADLVFYKAAASRRVTTLGLVKDTVLPLADVILDVLNFIDFVKRRYFLWMACLVCGLVFNGIASATLQQARPGRAMLNFVTFGTFGQVAEGVDSYTKGVKTETLLRQKMVEGLESVLSLLAQPLLA
ncbi:hypothetical protein AK812_SmicGene6051 [Symbiodinium microadriaticum]|uniref:Uncharacterized protein n=1 Tax=Symbiodinium microadriaticum TaxID=2951 RepID=A0A1Q9ES95_SYMMI|nr:hypothetical protein AK812_SmicGene6051 [Symbiodinium microadriaticum]